MRSISRFKRGIALIKDSLLVLKDNPKLTLFPVLSGVSALAFLALFLGSTFGVFTVTGSLEVSLALLFVGYLVTTFITVFFTAALVSESRNVFDGAEPDLKRGMAAAWAVRRKLLAWALISATVGVILNAIESSSDSPVAQVLAVVVGVAWTVMTFFVIPTAVLDRDSTVKDMFTRSGSIFKDQWGETIIGFGGVRLIDAAFSLVGVGLGALVYTNTGNVIAAALVAIPFIVAGALLSQTVRGIVKTSLYVYAREGKRPSQFDDQDFDNFGGGGKPGQQSGGQHGRASGGHSGGFV